MAKTNEPVNKKVSFKYVGGMSENSAPQRIGPAHKRYLRRQGKAPVAAPAPRTARMPAPGTLVLPFSMDGLPSPCPLCGRRVGLLCGHTLEQRGDGVPFLP